ncbi:MAG: SulP family inorganic anion transporter [Phycisphaerales bacterium]|nr:SulP family inorganic anion transporter [Phycisphaerales bacterium]
MSTGSTATGNTKSVIRDIFRHDLPSSIVVFFVALPLCMGIAIASGVPVSSGIITGIIGGIVVGALSGSPMQVSGPAAGLTVIIYGIVSDPSLAVHLAVIVLAAGTLQIFAGILRLGQWFRAVSPAVIQGMLAGIGIIIFSQQCHVMVDDNPRKTPVENILSLPEAVEKGIFPLDTSQHHQAAYVGLLSIAIIIFWRLGVPKKLRVVPAPLVAIVTATIISYVIELPIIKIVLTENMLGAFALPTMDSLKALTDLSVFGAALTIAVVASAETLLCANAVDQLHTGPRTKYDKELFAQGVGNVLCGFFSALPMTGVIVRSSANVEAGARSRASAILHGIWLLVFVWFLTDLLAHVPRASLAAILVFTGYKLVNVNAIKKIYKDSPSEVLVYLATTFSIVYFNLLTGIAIGFGLALLKLVYTFSHLVIKFEDVPDENTTYLHLHGAATFIRLPKLAMALERVPPMRELHVFMEDLDYIDHACLTLLVDWEEQHKATGGTLKMDWSELHPRFARQSLAPAEGSLARRSNGDAPANRPASTDK